jgi:hypothetical protein
MVAALVGGVIAVVTETAVFGFEGSGMLFSVAGRFGMLLVGGRRRAVLAVAAVALGCAAGGAAAKSGPPVLAFSPSLALGASAAPELSSPSITTFTATGGFNTTAMRIFNATRRTSLVQKSMTNPDAFEKGGPVPADGRILSPPGGIHYEVLSPRRGSVQNASLTYDAVHVFSYLGEITMKIQVTDARRDNVTYTCEVRKAFDSDGSLGCWFTSDGEFNVGDGLDPDQGEEHELEPDTMSTDGTTIEIFNIVTSRNARFIPVIVSAAEPRKFTARIQPLKGDKEALATGRLTLEHKHGGHGTIRVRLSAEVKPGTYDIVGRATTLNGKQVGKPLKVKFTLN